MYAIRQEEFGGPEVLVLREVPDLVPGPGQVRIAMRAAGVHLIDTTIRSGIDHGPMPAPELPMTPGRDIAGIVDQVGADVDSEWIGQRVVTYLGPASGGYAEHALAAAERLHQIPDALDFDVAVAAVGTGRTATAILDHVTIGADDTVLITSAAGGLGVLFAQHARSVGATVIGAAGSPAKLNIAREAGAGHVVDYTQPGWDAAVTTQVGSVSLVLDGVGGEIATRAFDLLGDGGTFAQFGWASGEPVEFDDPMRSFHNLLAAGVISRPIEELEAEALAAAASGTRVPVVGSRFKLAEAAAAHRALEDRFTHGKVVLIP